MGPFNGWELLILLVVFMVIVGPQRLPEYTRNIVKMVRRARTWVDESRESVESEMGIAVDDLKKYDPRQYDPRRIIREAWGDTTVEDLVPDTSSIAGAVTGTGAAAAAGSLATAPPAEHIVDGRAPWDDEAT